MKPNISDSQGYQMVASGNLPKLSIGYLKKSLWCDLYTNKAKECLEHAIQRHLAGLGANVSTQVMNQFEITKVVLTACRKTYKN